MAIAHGRIINRWWVVSRLFLLCGAIIGLALRFYFVKPFPISFHYWLHAHSHTLLLGWIDNALLLLLYRKCFPTISRVEKICIGLLQIGVAGMLVSFPFQGYGLVAIAFSSLHLIVSDVLAGLIWIRIKAFSTAHAFAEKFVLLVRLAVAFQFLCTLGPLMLGYLSAKAGGANALQHTAFYQLSLFYYLHFLYNGVFFYILLALWLPLVRVKNFHLYAMAAGTVLTFAHAVLYVHEWWLWSLLAVMGSAMQLGVWLIWVKQDLQNFKQSLGWMLMAAMTLKFVLQIAGSFPPLSHLVITQRFWLMAYLHFLFLGIYTPFIWVMAGVQRKFFSYGLYYLLWLSTEGLLLMPYLLRKTHLAPEVWYACIFAVYAGLVVLLIGITYRLRVGKNGQ
jgi:hypothetical protein